MDFNRMLGEVLDSSSFMSSAELGKWRLMSMKLAREEELSEAETQALTTTWQHLHGVYEGQRTPDVHQES